LRRFGVDSVGTPADEQAFDRARIYSFKNPGVSGKMKAEQKPRPLFEVAVFVLLVMLKLKRFSWFGLNFPEIFGVKKLEHKSACGKRKFLAAATHESVLGFGRFT